MLFRRLLGFCLVTCIAVGCQQQPRESLPELQSIFKSDSTHSRILKAEQYLAQWDFPGARKEFHVLSQREDLESAERDYLLQNEILSALMSLDTVGCKIQSAAADGPAALVHQLNLFLCDPARNIGDLRQFISALEAKNQTNSVHYLIALEKLAWYNYTYVSQIDTAIVYCKRALLLTESFNDLKPHQGFLLYSLAELSIMLRDVRAGFSYVQRGILVNSKPEVEERLVGLKGTLYRRLKSYDSADLFYSQAEALCTQRNDDYVLSEVLRERALMAIILNDDSAFIRIMGQLNSIDSTKRSQKVNADRLFGFFYLIKKRYPQCIEHYENALPVLERQYDLDIVQIGEACYALNESCRETKQFEKAELYSFKSLTASTANREMPYTWANLVSPKLYTAWPNSFVMYGLMADTYLDHYRHEPKLELLKKSFELYQLTDDVMERQLRANEEEAWLNYASAVGDRMYSGGITTCYELYAKTKDTVFLHKAHRFMERSKAMIVYRDILTRQSDYFPEVPSEFRERDLQLKSRIEYLKGTGDLSNRELQELLEEQRQYIEEARSKYPAFYKSLFELSIPSFSSCAALGRDENVSIIQYHLTSDFIYILKYDAPYSFIRLPRDSTFDRSLKDFRNLVGLSPNGLQVNQKKFIKCAHDMYQRLVLPLGLLKNSVLFVTDGVLTQLPFEAFISKPGTELRTCRYLVQDADIDYSYSLKISMVNKGIKVQNIDNVLGYSYSFPEEEEAIGLLPALPGASAELASIRKSFSGRNLVFRSGDQASKGAFMEDLRHPFELVHVAMHASSSPKNRWDNKIYFQKGKKSLDTLYASEIISRKISASLVVLTGCSTSAGNWVRGEGAYTLARAFHRAGAKKVVASLWPLPDKSSATISGRFYFYLVSGKSVSMSLRLAKLDFLKGADSNLAHPYFWAGLICL